MTEMAEGTTQSQSNNSSVPVSSSESVSAPQTHSQTADERFFKQSEVNDIIKKAKYGAVEDYKRLQSNQPEYANQKYGDAQPSSNLHTSNLPIDESNVRKIASELIQRSKDEWIQEAQNRSEEENARKLVENFHNKLSTGKEKYEDFDDTVKSVNFGKFTNTVQLATLGIDNTQDVIYHLCKRPLDLANFERLCRDEPNLAYREIARLSQSIKDNESASKMRTPNEPLSQMRPSNTGTDNGAMSVSDYRRKYRV